MITTSSLAINVKGYRREKITALKTRKPQFFCCGPGYENKNLIYTCFVRHNNACHAIIIDRSAKCLMTKQRLSINIIQKVEEGFDFNGIH